MRKTILGLGLGVLAVVLSVQAADTPTHGMGTYVTAADIKAMLATKDMTKGSDTVLRLVDGNTSNVGVAVVHRPKDPKGTVNNVLQHSEVIEIYYVLEGNATMVTGGSLKDSKPFPPGPDAATQSIGPGLNSTSTDTTGSVSRDIGPGDIVIIPAGATHYFSSISTDITYLVYRIDPSKKSKLM